MAEPDAGRIGTNRVLLNGSSTAAYGSFTTPVAAIRLTVNALSSAGAKVTATLLQAGIG